MKKILLLTAVVLSSASMLSAASNAVTNARKVHTTNVDGLSLVKVNTINEAKTSSVKALKANTNAITKTNVISNVSTQATETLSSFYDRPDGFYFWGLSADGSRYSVPLMLGNAFSPATWTNLSTGATSYTWTYDDPNGIGDKPAPLTSTSKDLTVTYPFNAWNLPTLVASDGTTQSSYQMNTLTKPGLFFTGGRASMDNKMFFGLSSQDFSEGMTAYYATAVGDWHFGTGPSSKESGIIGVATYMEKPTHSYLLSSVFVLVANFVADADAEFTVTVTKINDDGKPGDVIATGKCLASDLIIVAPDKIGGSVGTLSFTLTQKGISGLEEDVTPTIDSAIIVSFSGYQDNPKVKSMTTRISKNEPRTTFNSGYLLVKDKDGEFFYPISKYFETPLYTAPSIFMDIAYTWFETEGDTFEAPVTGGEKTFDVNAFFYTSSWTVEEEDAGTLPAWLTVTKADGATDKDPGKLTFTVEALPAGVTGRATNVTMSIPGSKKTFRITQGDSGVEGVKTSAIKVASVGGDFEVSYPTSVSSVNIYNVSGQLVNRVELNDGGNATIPAQNLAKGMYILKFNDNSTVKAIK
ncbi:MAG: T9SS type A sorting domain-containing protein [Muribaculaceae bacterium]